MSYTSLASVQALMARINENAAFSGSTAPTSTQITTMIADLSAEIDMHLASAGYVTPVASPATAVTWLGLVCQYGVVAEVLKAMFPESQQSSGGGPVVPAYAFWENRYQKALTLIDSRTMAMPGVDRGDGSILPSSYLSENPNNGGLDGSDGVQGSNWGEGGQPVFGMSQRF